MLGNDLKSSPEPRLGAGEEPHNNQRFSPRLNLHLLESREHSGETTSFLSLPAVQLVQ